MNGEADRGKISQVYAAHRPYLVDLAFRMLGDIGAAEDVVQDAFSRLMRADVGAIEDERGWLIVVTSRLSLDQIRSAHSRRERSHDAAAIEFVAPPERAVLADPADRVTFDDGVRLALLVVLQELSPAERVVFVLHDIFQVPFATVAATVGRTVPSCRQLARRARQKISARHTRFDVAAAEHALVTRKFIAACASGDLDGLLEVLAPDAWGDADLGPGIHAPAPAIGAASVAGNLIRFWGPGATLVSYPGGQPAILGFRGRQLAGILVLTMGDEDIKGVHVIGDPVQLSFLGSQLSGVTIRRPASSLPVPPADPVGAARAPARARTADREAIMLDLKIIVGSTRPGRAADLVIPWITAATRAHGGFGTDVLDLRDWELPVFTETFASVGDPANPSFSAPVVRQWNQKVAEGDAYLFVTPEYNHSVPAVLKNAIDSVFATFAFRGKPAACVAYSGGIAGGVRAVEHLAQIAIEAEMVPLRNTVIIPFVTGAFDENGQPRDPRTSAAAKILLDDLAWWGGALRQARSQGTLPPAIVRLTAAQEAGRP